MIKTDIKTTTYRDGDWLIDIVDNHELWEVWLFHEQYGIKGMMFGFYKKDIISYDALINIVENNLPTHKAMYANEWFDEGEQ